MAVGAAGSGGGFLLFNQLGHGFADLCALGDPVVQALGVQAHALLFFVGNGVVEAHALDKAAVAAVARVSYDYVEKRAVFRAAAC